MPSTTDQKREELIRNIARLPGCLIIRSEAEKIADFILARDAQREVEIRLKAEIKVHDEYWHSQRYVEENGISAFALANKEAAELELRNLKQSQATPPLSKSTEKEG